MSESARDHRDHIDKGKYDSDSKQDVFPPEEQLEGEISDKCDLINNTLNNDEPLFSKIDAIGPQSIELADQESCLNLEHIESDQICENVLDKGASDALPNGNTEDDGPSNGISSNVSETISKDSTPSIIENGSFSSLSISSDKCIFDSQRSVASVNTIRRNSLPEGFHGNLTQISKSIPNSSSSVNFIVESPSKNGASSIRPPSLQMERAKIAPNMHNISDVVRNVHGLFSIVKNAYKPMEKNIGEIMMATHKNLSSAKNGYLQMKLESKSQQNSKEYLDNLSKYSTLNLSNENEDLDARLFSKCDKFAPANDSKRTDLSSLNLDNEKNVQKTNEVEEKLVLVNGKLDKSYNNCIAVTGNVIKNLDKEIGQLETEMKEKQNDDHLHRSSQIVEGNAGIQIGSFTIEEESYEPSNADENTTEILKASNEKRDEKMKRDSESMEVLEATVLEQNVELDALRAALSQKEAVKKDLEQKITNISRQLEASVMRYAVSERAAMAVEGARAAAAGREARALEEASLLERRLRAAQAERTRICDMLDEKSHEVTSAHKEVARLKEELQGCEVKLKWTQNKLMGEMEAHKEVSSLAERLGHQIHQLESGANSNNHSLNIQQSTEIDVQIKEKEASAILERHERQRLETLCRQLQTELEHLKATMSASAAESRELRAQVGSSAAEAEALRDACSELRSQAARDCERLAAAQARAARVDTLSAHLQQEQERCTRLQQELELEKRGRSEALAEAELSVRREAELLRQAERLTEAGVRLQATCSEAEAKALALSVDNASLRAAAARESERRARAAALAEQEREGRAADARALAAAAARHQRAERAALQRLEQTEGDAKAAATKHASAVKELKREIQQWKRKWEKLELESHVVHAAPAKPAQRTGSCSSLSSYEGSSAHHNNSQTDSLEPILDVQVDRQQLVERIVQLQRAGARRSERLEFLEGHSAQLTAELQKKSRLLRAMLAATPAGALAAPASDCAKAEIGRHGGIMASVFNHEVSDSSMTLELSLEMNAKLQSLLEDTLLKNITLKENMDTLGDEIARLKEDLCRRQKK